MTVRGKVPGIDADAFKKAAEAARDGCPISQALKGSVDLGEYATGSALARAGVISGYDMTAEAALAKMYYLFSRGWAPAKVKREMQRDLYIPLSSVREARNDRVVLNIEADQVDKMNWASPPLIGSGGSRPNRWSTSGLRLQSSSRPSASAARILPPRTEGATPFPLQPTP